MTQTVEQLMAHVENYADAVSDYARLDYPLLQDRAKVDQARATLRTAIEALVTENAGLRADMGQGKEYYEAYIEECNDSFQVIMTEKERLRAALDKLARLGNEPDYGNSIGNEIAIAALKGTTP